MPHLTTSTCLVDAYLMIDMASATAAVAHCLACMLYAVQAPRSLLADNLVECSYRIAVSRWLCVGQWHTNQLRK
jgi:hypothetical protein